MLPFLVPVLFTFYLQGVLKKIKNSGAKRLTTLIRRVNFGGDAAVPDEWRLQSHMLDGVLPVVSTTFQDCGRSLVCRATGSLSLLSFHYFFLYFTAYSYLDCKLSPSFDSVVRQIKMAENVVIITIFIICSWGFTRWQWIMYMCTIYNIATKFTSGGLHEKHVLATWNFGNNLSICY
jgi:hypothetical protein